MRDIMLNVNLHYSEFAVQFTVEMYLMNPKLTFILSSHNTPTADDSVSLLYFIAIE